MIEYDKVKIVCGINDFELAHIFECGQCFRWEKQEDGSYTGVARGRVINISKHKAKQLLNNIIEQDIFELCDVTNANCKKKTSLKQEFDENDLTSFKNSDCLVFKNCKSEEFESIWYDYFDLSRDYSVIKADFASKDEIIAKAIEFGQGIRILKQDTWESIISFIISQNNNIPRIRGCIEKLCQEFGEYIGSFEGKEYYDIPTPAKLATLHESDLASIKLGYRARYIIESAKQIIEKFGEVGAQGDLTQLEMYSTEEAYEFIHSLCGVGPKVASCILLFGLGRVESFPIDTWVKKVMHELYGIAESDTKAMECLAKERFGEYSGIAQQYLFYYMRELGKKNM